MVRLDVYVCEFVFEVYVGVYVCVCMGSAFCLLWVYVFVCEFISGKCVWWFVVCGCVYLFLVVCRCMFWLYICGRL